MLLSSSILMGFRTVFDARGTRSTHGIARNTHRSFGGQGERDKWGFDCAGANGSRIWPCRKPHKYYRNRTCESSRSRCRCFTEDRSTATSTGSPLGLFGRNLTTILAIGTIALKALENTTFLMAQGLEHRRTRVLEGSRMAVGGGGVAPLWPLRKTTIWHRNMRFYLSFSYFSGKWVGAGP